MSEIHEIKCSICKRLLARIELLNDNANLKILKWKCLNCNSTIDDITWIDGVNQRIKDRKESFEAAVKMNSSQAK